MKYHENINNAHGNHCFGNYRGRYADWNQYLSPNRNAISKETGSFPDVIEIGDGRLFIIGGYRNG